MSAQLLIFARSRSAYPQRPLTPLCKEHALTGRGASHAKKSKDISVFASRFEPSTELKALDCTFVRALVYILHFFFCFAFFSFASVCMSALTLAKMTLCRSATLQALGPSMACASPFEGYVSLYHLHRTMATPHCITTNFCAKSLKRCLVQCVSFFFLHAKASNVCINKWKYSAVVRKLLRVTVLVFSLFLCNASGLSCFQVMFEMLPAIYWSNESFLNIS